MKYRLEEDCKKRLCRDCEYAERGANRTLTLQGKEVVFATYTCKQNKGGGYYKIKE